MSDGSIGDRPVDFTATGGAVDAEGSYRAGTATGQYRVIARAGSAADTSSVVIVPVPVASVAVALADAALEVGETTQATATLRDAGGALLSGREITWSSSNPAVASVSSSGLVTARDAGSAAIRATSEGRSATAALTVTRPAPSLTSLALTPDAVTLDAGATRQFAAAARWSDGSSRQVAVAWQATGGSISTAGLYTAGNQAGTFRVIAAATDPVSGTARADSATVTIRAATPPPPPPPPGDMASCGNEPAGMRVATNTPWDAVPPPLPQHDAYGWGWEYTDRNLSIVQDPTAPRSPGNVLRTTYPAGFRGGSAPANIEVDLEGSPTTVYVCYWVKRSANWTDNGNAGTKFFFVYATSSHGYVAMNRNLTHHFALESGSVPNIDYYGPPDDVGTWRKYEYLFVANTPGQANGTFTAWKNGVPFMSRTGIRWAADGRTPAFNRVQWSPTYGGGRNSTPYTLTQDIDHWYISVK
jgi:hypothetical protein